MLALAFCTWGNAAVPPSAGKFQALLHKMVDSDQEMVISPFAENADNRKLAHAMLDGLDAPFSSPVQPLMVLNPANQPLIIRSSCQITGLLAIPNLPSALMKPESPAPSP